LSFHLDRKDGKTSILAHSLDLLIKTIARYWVRVQEAYLNEWKRLCKRVGPKQEGLMAKNRGRPLRILKRYTQPRGLGFEVRMTSASLATHTYPTRPIPSRKLTKTLCIVAAGTFLTEL